MKRVVDHEIGIADDRTQPRDVSQHARRPEHVVRDIAIGRVAQHVLSFVELHRVVTGQHGRVDVERSQERLPASDVVSTSAWAPAARSACTSSCARIRWPRASAVAR